MADVRLRGSYQRAVRAANIVELFTGIGTNLFDAPGDPCGAAARDPTGERCGMHRDRRACGIGGRALARQPRGAVHLPARRQPGADAREVGHLLLRHRVPAALGAGSRRHGGLLRHPDRQRDLDFRRQQHLDGLLRQQRPGGLRSHLPQSWHRPVVDAAAAMCRTSTSTSARSRRRGTTSTSGTRASRSAAWAASRST